MKKSKGRGRRGRGRRGRKGKGKWVGSESEEKGGRGGEGRGVERKVAGLGGESIRSCDTASVNTQ